MADISSPYYITPSDNSSLQIVSHPLEGDNFNSWYNAMHLALVGRNKIIINSLSKEIASNINYTSTAAEIWADLQQRFLQQNDPRQFQLRRELSSISQGNSYVGSYFTKLKALWEEYNNHRPDHKCTCKGVQPLLDHFQREYVLTFLMGLNEIFSNIRGQILALEPMPNIQKAFP
ncbi:Retrotransposon gag domain [Sesbania bispinosa]|nr:Retrotransposon gag domain [Sesbania bispinosa]